jgi:hypothetical protein
MYNVGALIIRKRALLRSDRGRVGAAEMTSLGAFRCDAGEEHGGVLDSFGMSR